MLKKLRLFSWLLTALLLLGQEAAVLHHLGHDLRALASQGATTGTAGGSLDGSGAPASEQSDGACALCVGFGSGAALTYAARFDFDARFLVFVRPLGQTSFHQPVAPTGILIRGPPAHFSAIA